ncbi:hypothetical protein [Pantoea ananatis]|jgi:hypothetical protein|uniref:hypothetical protein n=1 Tax=Pantoea ananas TaxID=553 RepID=UPI00119F7F2C|nr:hypothetical protein [Pantoea ananatis]
MNFKFITDVLEENGLTCIVDDGRLYVEINDMRLEIKFIDDYLEVIDRLSRSRQYNFCTEKNTLVSYREVEVVVQRLNQNTFEAPKFEFKSNSTKKVVLSRASKEFSLSHMKSEDYKKYFHRIVKIRMTRRIKSSMKSIYFDALIWHPITIKYILKRKISAEKMLADAMQCFDSCLYKLAVDHSQAWELFKSRRLLQTTFQGEDEVELNIPFGCYDKNLVNYYKVAVSSQFPSQSFLSYYHVLEYNFLSVSEEELQSKIRANIQSTNFNGSSTDIITLINVVKKHTDKSDEKDMLMRVLRKYVDQDDLKEFIKRFETATNDKLYTKSRKVFGQSLSININNEHMMPNVAQMLKHIRNALVHSSDKYNRDDCHIPLTESEELVSFYVPLVRFLAEQVISAK